MDYPQALAGLHALQRYGVQPGLSRIRELLRRLGDPQRGGPRYLHITGTNGKGSTAAMLAAMLQAAGRRTALFTSPHLHHHCERYRMDGRPMPEADFAAIFSEVAAAIRNMTAEGWESPTEFEAATAVALLWFRRCQSEVAVIECGMGGAHDSTNVIDGEVAVITGVALDHMDFLGTTVAEIAAEKAGILRPGRPAVTAASGEALTVIADAAQRQRVPLYVLGRDFNVYAEECSLQGWRCTVETARQRYCGLQLPLLGAHQLANAALAVQTAELAAVSGEAIRSGLAQTSWPGRLELISRQPDILLDGAHNVQGMAALTAALDRYWPGRRICCLLGMLADKQREEALALLLPKIRRAVVTPPPLAARAGDWRQLAAICRQAGVPAEEEADGRRALALSRRWLEEGDCDLLLVCGSLYLIAEIRALLLGKEG